MKCNSGLLALTILFSTSIFLTSCNTKTSSDADAGVDSSVDAGTGESVCWWEPVDIDTNVQFHRIWGPSAENIYIGGRDSEKNKGIVLEYNANEWSEKWSIDNHFPWTVWGTAENDLYFSMYVFEGNTSNITGFAISHWDGSTWANTSIPDAVYQLFGFATDDVYAMWGSVYHYDGTEWSLIYNKGLSPGEPEGALYSMWGDSPDNMFFAGSGAGYYDGVIMHYDGVSFTEVSCGYVIGDIHGISSDQVYAVGNYYIEEDLGAPELDHATMLKYDGDSWFSIKYFYGYYEELRSVWASPAGEVFVAGTFIYRYDDKPDGDGWTKWENPEAGDGEYNVMDIWGADLDHLFAVLYPEGIVKYECTD